MPVQQFSGQGFPRNPDPTISTTNSARGTYPWSAFRAQLGEINGGIFVGLSGVFQGSLPISLLLFTSDTPAICNAVATYIDGHLQFSSPVANTLSFPYAVTTVGGATPATADNYGGSVSGFSGVLRGVPVAGFPAQVDVFAPLDSGESIANSIYIDCLANGTNIYGVIGYNNAGLAAAPAPIILGADQYTLAMRESNNLVNIGADLYQIVGLWGFNR